MARYNVDTELALVVHHPRTRYLCESEWALLILASMTVLTEQAEPMQTTSNLEHSTQSNKWDSAAHGHLCWLDPQDPPQQRSTFLVFRLYKLSELTSSPFLGSYKDPIAHSMARQVLVYRSEKHLGGYVYPTNGRRAIRTVHYLYGLRMRACLLRLHDPYNLRQRLPVSQARKGAFDPLTPLRQN